MAKVRSTISRTTNKYSMTKTKVSTAPKSGMIVVPKRGVSYEKKALEALELERVTKRIIEEYRGALKELEKY